LLRKFVRHCIEAHIPPEEFERLRTIQQNERQKMPDFLSAWRGEGRGAIA
jgi:hypothetical protein